MAESLVESMKGILHENPRWMGRGWRLTGKGSLVLAMLEGRYRLAICNYHRNCAENLNKILIKNPELLFPIWDREMFKDQGLKEQAKRRGILISDLPSCNGYLEWNSWMAEEGREIIDSIIKNKKCRQEDTLSFLQNKYLKSENYQAKIPKTLPEMLDEYFYARYSKKWYIPSA